MTKKDHSCEDCEDDCDCETYSDDNCKCFGQVINTQCPRHGRKSINDLSKL